MSKTRPLFVSLIECFGETRQALGTQVRIYFDAVFELVELGYLVYRGHVEAGKTRLFLPARVYKSNLGTSSQLLYILLGSLNLPTTARSF